MEQQQVQKAKISEFLSVCAQLAFQSCKIINNIQVTDGKQTQMKDIDDPMTIADVKAQTLIIKGLRQYWPNLNIIGEEDIEYEGDLGFDVKNLNPQMIKESYFMQGKQNIDLNNEFEIEKAIVWVDPLDGTLSYVNNELDCVTTLIGLSYEQQPLIGIIGQPYQLDEQNKFKYNPTIYFGHGLQNEIYYFNQEQHKIQEDQYSNNVEPSEFIVKQRQIKENGDRQIVCSTSKNHMNPEHLQIVKNLNPDKIVQYGGAGKKLIDVIRGDTDYTIYIGKGTKKWDTAAGEALLRCKDGILTATDGTQYLYQKEPELHRNMKGVIAATNTDLHQKIIEQTKNIQN